MSRFVLAAWLATGAASILGCGNLALREPIDLFQKMRLGMSSRQVDEVIQQQRKVRTPLLPGQYVTAIEDKPFRVKRTTVGGKVREARQYRTGVKWDNMGVRGITEGRLVEIVFEDDSLISWRTRDRPFIRLEEPTHSAP